ncbi:MAG TPA: hypothetical protein G4N96_13705 [Chloroflexi bacterium]|nr:hypothetical protein [Chloroflexota bacterium]
MNDRPTTRLNDYQTTRLPDHPTIRLNDYQEEFEARRPGLLANLLIILMILAMLATIVRPLFVYGLPSPPTPTPTPAFQKSA